MWKMRASRLAPVGNAEALASGEARADPAGEAAALMRVHRVGRPCGKHAAARRRVGEGRRRELQCNRARDGGTNAEQVQTRRTAGARERC